MDPERVTEDRDLKLAKLEPHIAEVVAKFPPLTEEQCQRVAAMLRAGTRRIVS